MKFYLRLIPALESARAAHISPNICPARTLIPHVFDASHWGCKVSFTPSPAYQIVLDRLVAAREEGDTSIEELAQLLHLTIPEVEAFESGKQRLDFAQTRQWCGTVGLDFERFLLQVAQDIDALPAPSHPLERDDVENPASSPSNSGEPK